jgi:hypothetical protein
MKFNRPTEEQIRSRAREIFLRNGSQPGHDLDNWLQAEYELMQLPVRKLVELEPTETKPGKASKAPLVNLVHAAQRLAASKPSHLGR